MKKSILLVVGLLITLYSVATDKTNSLVIRGIIRDCISVDYTIGLIIDENTIIQVKQERVFKTYKICLEIGRDYRITFTNGHFIKSLTVNADCIGVYLVDVDFTNQNDASLFYNYTRGKYQLNVLKPEYAEN